MNKYLTATGSINDGKKANKSMQYISRVRNLPEVFLASSPVKRTNGNNGSKKRGDETRLFPEVAVGVHKNNEQVVVDKLDEQGDQEDRIQRIAENIGFKLPRSLSQPKYNIKKDKISRHKSLGERGEARPRAKNLKTSNFVTSKKIILIIDCSSL